MTMYYEVLGMIDGKIEILFGSFAKADCIHELMAEKDSWKEDGYKAIQILPKCTDEKPDMEVYTAEELYEGDY